MTTIYTILRKKALEKNQELELKPNLTTNSKSSITTNREVSIPSDLIRITKSGKEAIMVQT
jgi:hypothetical protein